MRHLATLLMFMWLVAASCGAAEPPGRNDLPDPVFQRADLPEPVFLTAMAQDNNGFFWLGTQNGLFLWDGYRFHGVPVDPSRRDALPDGFINVLHTDGQGRLWIGMAAGGLARLGPGGGKPVAVEIGPAGPSHMNVLSMCDDVRGGLWVGTAAGLGHVDSDGAASRRGADPPALQFAGQRVNAVVQDASGTLWVGTGKGLFAASKPATGFVRVPLPAAGDDGAPTVTRLMIDGAGRLWIGTRSHGVFVVEREARSARQVRDTEAGDRRLEGDTVRAMLDLRDGRIWIGTLGGGIVEVRPADGSTRRIRHYQEVDPSLPKDEVYTLLRDIHGRVWVGTGEALSSHDPTQRGIATWFGIGGRPGRLGHPNVDVVLALPDDSVWLGIGEGIEIIDFSRGRIGQLEPDPRQPKAALPRARVLAMARAADGGVYIGTQQGLYRADAAGRSVRRVEMAGRDETAPAWALCASGDRLWLGDLQGLWEIRVAPGEHAELMSHEQLVLGRSHVSSIACDDPRSVWVGTHAGLARYDKVRGTAEWLDTDAPGKAGMPRGFITSVRSDARGRLWVSSYGGGLRVLEPGPAHPPVLHRIGAEGGLVQNAANAAADRCTRRRMGEHGRRPRARVRRHLGGDPVARCERGGNPFLLDECRGRDVARRTRVRRRRRLHGRASGRRATGSNGRRRRRRAGFPCSDLREHERGSLPARRVGAGARTAFAAGHLLPARLRGARSGSLRLSPSRAGTGLVRFLAGFAHRQVHQPPRGRLRAAGESRRSRGEMGGGHLARACGARLA